MKLSPIKHQFHIVAAFYSSKQIYLCTKVLLIVQKHIYIRCIRILFV